MKITELYQPEARAHLIHLIITGQSLLQTEYRPSSSREYGLGSDGSGMMIRTGGVGGEEECMQSLQRKSILKNKPNCDSSPDIIPHHDHGKLNYIPLVKSETEKILIH